MASSLIPIGQDGRGKKEVYGLDISRGFVFHSFTLQILLKHLLGTSVRVRP